MLPDRTGITPDIWYHANLMCPDFLQGLRETIIMGELHVVEFVRLEPFSRPGNKENGKIFWKIFVHCHQKRKIVLSSRFAMEGHFSSQVKRFPSHCQSRNSFQFRITTRFPSQTCWWGCLWEKPSFGNQQNLSSSYHHPWRRSIWQRYTLMK